MRLSRGRDFLAVRHGGVRVNAGPLTFSVRPNNQPHARLGLSIGRRVGSAVKRNTIKRRLREVFRLMQHELPVWGEGTASPIEPSPPQRSHAEPPATADLPQAAGVSGYDVVIAARPHEALSVSEYQRLFVQAMREAHQSWQKKRQRSPSSSSKPKRPRPEDRA